MPSIWIISEEDSCCNGRWKGKTDSNNYQKNEKKQELTDGNQ
jgi:hypothetical protein